MIQPSRHSRKGSYYFQEKVIMKLTVGKAYLVKKIYSVLKKMNYGP